MLACVVTTAAALTAIAQTLDHCVVFAGYISWHRAHILIPLFKVNLSPQCVPTLFCNGFRMVLQQDVVYSDC